LIIKKKKKKKKKSFLDYTSKIFTSSKKTLLPRPNITKKKNKK